MGYTVIHKRRHVGRTPAPDAVAVGGGGGGTDLTTFTLKSTGGGTQTNMPFEQVITIPPATMLPNEKLTLIDDTSVSIPLQEDQRRTDKDGYLRLVKISGAHPSLPAGITRTVSVKRLSGSPATDIAITVQNVLDETVANGFDILVTLTMPDTSTFTASAREAIQAASTWSTTTSRNRGNFRAGGYCTEMIVDAPFKNGGTPHAFLRCNFHLAFWKGLSGAWNVSTNPIIFCDAGVIIDNGYMRVASPADAVYDLLIQVGNSVKTTVYTLDGSAGDTTLTLSATSGANQTATRSGGSWVAASSTPNSNDAGKAIVEVGGSGRAAMNGRRSNTSMYIQIPSGTAFASVTRTSGQWRKMGVYHYYHTRLEADVTWGTPSAYDSYVSASWLKTSQMVLNYAANAASITPDLTFVNDEGQHPMSMKIDDAFSRITNFGVAEAATGDVDHIGVISFSFVSALVNWDDVTDRANAKILAQRNALAGNKKPFWIHDEEHGGLPTLDDSGLYVWSSLAGTSFPQILTDYTAGTQWFGFANNHTGHTAYLPYLLWGKLRHLEAAIMHVADINIRTTDYGLFGSFTPCTLNGSGPHTAAAHPQQTGEAVEIEGDTRPQVGGVTINIINRYFFRSLSSSTFELYDTYANAMAGPATTGRVTFSNNGVNCRLQNGYDKSGFPVGANSNQTRQMAWCLRTLAQLAMILPDSVTPEIVGRSWNQTNLYRHFDKVGTYMKTTYADDSNFVANGPRWTDEAGSFSTVAPWQTDYLRMALWNAWEGRSLSSDWIALADWSLASAIQVAVVPNFSTYFAVGAVPCGYYLRNKINGGAIQYTWTGLQAEMIKRADNPGLWTPTGFTADIASVAGGQANVTVVLKAGGVEATFFDATSQPTLDRHIGAWLGVGGGKGQIKSVSSKGTCVVDCTVSSWDGADYHASMIAGNGQSVLCPPASHGNAIAVAGTQMNYTGGYGEHHYMTLARSSMGFAKDRGIDVASYATADAYMTARGVPSRPPSSSDISLCATQLKHNISPRT